MIIVHGPHSYFHVIIICSYPAVRVKKIAYVNMLGRNDLITYYLLERTAVAASLQLRIGLVSRAHPPVGNRGLVPGGTA